jgi:hypothetical protein
MRGASPPFPIRPHGMMLVKSKDNFVFELVTSVFLGEWGVSYFCMFM